MAEEVPLEQFTDQMKKAKKVPESWELTFHKVQYLKPSNINLTSVSKHVRKKLWNLLTHSYNLLTNKYNQKNSKLLKKILLYILVLNNFQYKQCLCILTLPKCND